jgi:hypothetical protein
MPNRDRFFQERLAELEQQWLSGSSDARLSIEREEVILRAQERAEIAELRLAHAEEIVRKLDRRS